MEAEKVQFLDGREVIANREALRKEREQTRVARQKKAIAALIKTTVDAANADPNSPLEIIVDPMRDLESCPLEEEVCEALRLRHWKVQKHDLYYILTPIASD